MSSSYSTEPTTTGKVILKTNYGNIDIELWTNETQRTCRNFIQLCLEGYFDNCIFHRIIKEFMIQTGDPTGSGNGGESIWGKDFSDEFHSRLRFNHRGIVAMANTNKPNTNNSQFFISMDKCAWLDKKHTIFGKVVGDTFFNALSISQIKTINDYPACDLIPKILSTEVVINPFSDIIPRVKSISTNNLNKIPQKQNNGKVNIENLKNSNLLSFNEESNDDEILNNTSANKNKFKIKSVHEVIKNDKRIKNIPVVSEDQKLNIIKDENDKISKLKERIKDKLNKNIDVSESESEEDLQLKLPEIINMEESNKRTNDIIQVKNDILKIKKRMEDPESYSKDQEKENEANDKKLSALEQLNSQFLQQKKKRPTTKETIDKINKFKDKLKTAKTDEESWMNNKLKFLVDSQKAYTLNESKEKMERMAEYDAFKKFEKNYLQ